MSTVTYEKQKDGVAILRLNRPDRLNGLTLEMQIEYFELLDRANNDSDVRVIVVTGNGRAFCAGAELKLLDTIGKTDANVFAQTTTRSVAQMQATNIQKPIIAAINGPCAGLGLVLATMCDIRFSVKDAKFTTAFAKRGLPAEHGISYTLPKIVGLSNALDLLLSSRVIQGEEALRMGLVSQIFDNIDSLMKYTFEYAREMAVICLYCLTIFV